MLQHLLLIKNNNNNLMKIISQQFLIITNINIKRYAGHSKWANIRHIKALKDGQKSLQFIKLARQIRLAIEDGKSSNPLINSHLQSAIDEALKKNMPNQTIKEILKKNNNNNNKIQKKNFLEIIFLNKIAIICIVYTENLNKIKIDIGTLLKKSGCASLGEVRHLFDETGLLECIASSNILGDEKLLSIDCKEKYFEDICTEHAIECGAETIDIIDMKKRLISITCDPLHIESVKRCLQLHKYSVEFAEHIFIPKHPITLNSIEENTYKKFYDKLKSYDVIEEIYDNVI